MFCRAGSWWVNENMLFRPCATLPYEYLLLNYEDWNSVVQNVSSIDWDSCMRRLETSNYMRVSNFPDGQILNVSKTPLPYLPKRRVPLFQTFRVSLSMPQCTKNKKRIKTTKNSPFQDCFYYGLSDGT